MLRKSDDQLGKVIHAISDATRRTILEELSRRDEQSLFEIMVRLVEKHQLAITRQAISKHLKVLEEAGLIATSWSGRTKLHWSSVEDGQKLLLEWLQSISPEAHGRED